MKFNQTYKWLFLPLLSVLLSACNTDINDNKSSNKQSQDQKITLSADNAVDGITNGLKSYVSLEDKIHATSSLGDNMISEVVLLSEQQACRDIDVYASGYSINSADYIGTCIYQYSVKNTVDPTARAVAYSTVVVQEDEVGSIDKFELISETAEASVTLVINLADQLVDQIPDGYTLSETITNLGVGNASLDIGSQTITFISDQPGYSQIIYSYENDTQVKIGSINIAVSSELNTAPVAPNIDYSADINNETVNINTDVIIDVGSYISDPDDEPLQLVYVDSWYASVTPIDLSDENNTAFIFNTDRAGEHFVTYAISDHNGGYDIGQVRIEVYDPNSVASWGNIQQGLQLFYGPLTHAEAFGQGVMDTSTNFDQNRTVSTFNYADAKKSCESKGGLPSEAQLQELYDLSKPQSQGWPVGLSYWSNDVNKVVSLSNKQSSIPVGSDTYYVTCINEGGFVIDNEQSFTLDVIANGGSTNEGIAKVVVELTFNDQPLSGESITADIPSNTQAQLNASTVTTDENGSASFELTDIKAETVTFTAEYNGEERVIDITFIGDKNTAKLVSKATINNSDISSGVNEVVATLTDANTNGIKEEMISFTSNDAENISIISNSNHTDENGQQKAEITWIGSDDLAYDPEVLITSGYSLPDGTYISHNTNIIFSTAKLVDLVVVNNNVYIEKASSVYAAVKNSNGEGIAGREVEFITNNSLCKVNGQEAASGVSVSVQTDQSGHANAEITYSNPGNTDVSCEVTASLGSVSKNVTVNFFSDLIQYKYKQVTTGKPNVWLDSQYMDGICQAQYTNSTGSDWEAVKTGETELQFYIDMNEAGLSNTLPTNYFEFQFIDHISGGVPFASLAYIGKKGGNPYSIGYYTDNPLRIGKMKIDTNKTNPIDAKYILCVRKE
ncbi:Ig-like domain-containing protein [Aliivibrio fischeri]|uniref:Ig-like domain-containing protein n=1 Tax=Aliivibrio fischeri TaxID=668 RepID=UPI0012DA9EB6|nr:hypothetical protein [Aliivibrio fischeri]MUL16505.1 hypothetical protein [Aliivibrio fischeri]